MTEVKSRNLEDPGSSLAEACRGKCFCDPEVDWALLRELVTQLRMGGRESGAFLVNMTLRLAASLPNCVLGEFIVVGKRASGSLSGVKLR